MNSDKGHLDSVELIGTDDISPREHLIRFWAPRGSSFDPANAGTVTRDGYTGKNINVSSASMQTDGNGSGKQSAALLYNPFIPFEANFHIFEPGRGVILRSGTFGHGRIIQPLGVAQTETLTLGWDPSPSTPNAKGTVTWIMNEDPSKPQNPNLVMHFDVSGLEANKVYALGFHIVNLP